MPLNGEGTLIADEVYAVTAFLLFKSGPIGAQADKHRHGFNDQRFFGQSHDQMWACRPEASSAEWAGKIQRPYAAFWAPRRVEETPGRVLGLTAVPSVSRHAAHLLPANVGEAAGVN